MILPDRVIKTPLIQAVFTDHATGHPLVEYAKSVDIPLIDILGIY
jgi:hypothetical protein